MLLVWKRPADIPPAPAILERRTIIRDKSASDVFGGHSRGDVLRTDDQARNAQRLAALMALQADFAARKGWLSRPAGIQGVEDHALFWIERRHLHHLAMLYEPHRHLIVEVNGTGPLRRDQSGLKAVLRKHQH